MPAKYKQLVRLYSSEIAKVKLLKAKAEAAGNAVRAHMTATGEDFDEVEERQMYAAWNDAENSFQTALESLTDQMRMEYANVYGRAFEASIDAFFREAGLREAGLA